MSSTTLDQLHSRRLAIWNESKALLDRAEAEGRDFTADEASRFDQASRDMDSITARTTQIEKTERTDREVEETLLRTLGHGGAGSGNGAGPWLPSRRDYLGLSDVATRAVGGSGSVFVPAGQATIFADRLRSHSAIFGSGVQAIAVPNGSLRIPRVSASVTVSALSENTAITPSDPGFAPSTLTLRKLAAITVASNEAMSDSNPGLRQVISEDLVKQVATAADVQFLSGDGIAPNIKGIRNWVGVTAGPSLGAAGGTPTLATLAGMLTSFETVGGSVTDAVFFMHPRTWGGLRSIVDGQQRYQLNPTVTGAEQRSIFGVPVITSANIGITETVGASTDCSWIALVDKSQVVIGYGTPDASAAGGFGTAGDLGVELAYSDQFAFSSDQLAIRAILRTDIAPLNVAATVLTTGVRP